MVVDLEVIFREQKTLRERYGEQHPKSYYHHGPYRYPYEQLVLGMLAISEEFSEMMTVIPWKWWKELLESGYYKNFSFEGLTSEDKATEEQFKEGILKYLQNEMIDVGHFYIDMLNSVGIDAQKFFDLYMAKNKENHKRQDMGY